MRGVYVFMYIHVCTCVHDELRDLGKGAQLHSQVNCVFLYIHVYSTLALGKEREIVKEETALRKEKEAVCCYVHVDVHV